MHGDLISTIAGELKPWRTAFKGLPDNPLAKYFALMRKRRLARLPWYRRNAILIWGSVASAFYFLYVSLTWGSYMPGQGGHSPQQETIYTYLQAASGILGFAVSMVLFWLLQQLFGCLYFALGYLGSSGSKDSSERIDDVVGVSNVTNHELGAAVVSHNFGILCRPIIILTLLSQLSVIVQSAMTDLFFMSPGFNSGSGILKYSNPEPHEELLQFFLELPMWKQLLVTMPIDLVYCLVTSLLGVLIITGLFVVLGRNLRHSAALGASVVFFILWLIIFSNLISTGFAFLSSGHEYSFPKSLLIMVTGTLIIPGLSTLLMRASLRKHSFGAGLLLYLLLIFSPLVLILVYVVFGYMWNTSSYYGSSPGEGVFSTYLLEVAWGSSTYNPLSVASVFSGQNWQWMITSFSDFPWHEFLRAPILIVVQLLTLAGLSPLLLKAIALRRQGQE